MVFGAESLLPLTGIVTAAFLTRRLGAGDYGLLTLSVTLISWVEFGIISLFSRATVKLVREAADWRPFGSAVLRLQLWISLAAVIAVWLLAKPCALLLHEGKLAWYLSLLALDIPVLAMASCHGNLMVGRGLYNGRAKASAGRWIARLILMVLLVELGLSVSGAILGIIGASAVDLAIARFYIRPPWSSPGIGAAALWDYAVPIFLTILCLRVLGMDLFLIKIFGASAAQAGFYGAAQNVSYVLPGVFGAALSSLVLSTITRVLGEGDLAAARLLTRNAVRAVILALPLAAIGSAASNDIAVLLFGTGFAATGRYLAILVFAGPLMMLVHLLNAVMIASGRPSRTLLVSAPLVPLALTGHILLIPTFGPIGAACVSTAVAVLGAAAAMAVLQSTLGMRFPFATLLRSTIIAAGTWLACWYWPTGGFAVVVKVAALGAAVPAAFVAFGEFDRQELQFLWKRREGLCE